MHSLLTLNHKNPRRKMMTELTWRCVGYHTDRHMNDSLLYVTDTAAQAEALCHAHVPNYEIYYTQRVDDNDYH